MKDKTDEQITDTLEALDSLWLDVDGEYGPDEQRESQYKLVRKTITALWEENTQLKENGLSSYFLNHHDKKAIFKKAIFIEAERDAALRRTKLLYELDGQLIFVIVEDKIKKPSRYRYFHLEDLLTAIEISKT